MRNFHLVDWAMLGAGQLSFPQTPPSEPKPKAALNRPQDGIEGHLGKPDARLTDDAHFVGPPIEDADPDPVSVVPRAPNPDATCVSTGFAQANSTDAQEDSIFLLRKAIVEPDIFTSPGDRDRAIMLRWVLRDIKRNRLNFLPADALDLRDLIEMGLVEMHGEDAGFDARGD